MFSVWTELWGVLDGLRLAWDSGFKKVMVQVDNKMVAQAISMDKLLSCSNTDLIHAIKDILQKEWEVHLLYIYCKGFWTYWASPEGNMIADYMANYGFDLVKTYGFFEHPPIGAKKLLMNDMLVVYFPRMIQV
ncbi:Uncharacterized protein TCM_019860 [Theobroma cacao]|uniref:RNase H type-1 domain-containing protein n=1 Tax=Theobroma cacao TaxID=3641 RepID=A0A061EI62_THECC|nr:Uncharacterized protein TCM_019860 [Theobroma cacao]